MPNRRAIDETTDDTEGNRFHGIVKDGVEDEDTEGHAGHARFVRDGVEDDDTEGNSAKAGRSVPPAAKPGKVAKPRF